MKERPQVSTGHFCSLTIDPPTQHTSPICRGIFLIRLPTPSYPLFHTSPLLSVHSLFIHLLTYLPTHLHIHLPIHPSTYSSFPRLSMFIHLLLSLHTAIIPPTLLPIYLLMLPHRPASPSMYFFPSCHPPLNLSSGPSTHHSSVTPTLTHMSSYLFVNLAYCLAQSLRWAWHVAECSREDRLKRTWSIPACRGSDL